MGNRRILLAGSLWSLIGTAYSTIGGYVTLYLLTKALGYENYGHYVLVLSITSFLATTSLFGQDGSLMYFYPKLSKSGLAGLMRRSFIIIVLLSLISMAALLLAKYFISEQVFHDRGLAVYIEVMCSFVLFDAIASYCAATLRGSLNVKLKVIYEQMLSVTTTILILVIVLYVGYEKQVVAFIVLSKSLVSIAGILFLFSLDGQRRETHSIGKTDEISNQELLKYSFVYLSSVLVTAIYSGASPWLIGGLLNTKQVGTFDLISRLSQFVLFPMFVFDVTFAPMIARLFSDNNLADASRLFSFSTKIVSMLSFVVFTLAAFYFAEIAMVFGKEFFQNSYDAFMILMCGKLFHSLTGSSGWVLLMGGKNRLHLLNSVIFATTSIVLNYLLIPHFGLIGATLAISCSLMINKFLSTGQVRRHYGISPFMDGGNIFSGGLGLLASLMVLACFLPRGGLFVRSGLAILFILLAFLLLWITTGESERSYLKGMMRSTISLRFKI